MNICINLPNKFHQRPFLPEKYGPDIHLKIQNKRQVKEKRIPRPLTLMLACAIEESAQ